MKPLWIKWYPVNWLHSTARDEMTAAQRSTFQDFVCLAAISKTPGSFKFVNTESLSRMLNTDAKTIEETIKVCFDRKRISIRDDAEGRVMKILKWKVYQSFTSVNNKTDKALNNVNVKVNSSSLLSTSNISSSKILREGEGEEDLSEWRGAVEMEIRKAKTGEGLNGFELEAAVKERMEAWDEEHLKPGRNKK